MSARQNMPMQIGMGRGMHYLLPAQIHAGVKMNTGLMHQQIGMMQTGQQSHQFLLNDILNTTQTILQQQKEHHEQQNFNQQRILLPFFNVQLFDSSRFIHSSNLSLPFGSFLKREMK